MPDELRITDEERATIASLFRQAASAIERKDDAAADRLMNAIQDTVDTAARRMFDALGGPHASA